MRPSDIQAGDISLPFSEVSCSMLFGPPIGKRYRLVDGPAKRGPQVPSRVDAKMMWFTVAPLASGMIAYSGSMLWILTPFGPVMPPFVVSCVHAPARVVSYRL